MYQIFVADDNQLSRQALIASAKWEENDCQVVGEAANGRDALEKLLLLRPDIAFLDIKMPFCTGLEVVEQSRAQGLDCLFILITAYDDFAYIQQGLRLGVFDYLLKPVNDKAVGETLRKAVAVLQEKGRRKAELESLRENVRLYHSEREEAVSERIERLLGDGLSGYRKSAEHLEELLTETEKIHDCELLLVSVAQGQLPGASEEVVRRLRELLPALEKRFRVRLYSSRKREGLAVLILYRQVMLVRDYHLTALKIGAEFAALDQMEDVCIGISTCARRLTELPELFRQAVFCCNSRFFLENKNVIHYESVRSRSVRGAYVRMQKLDEFYRVCREQPDMLEQPLAALLAELEADPAFDRGYLIHFLIELCMMMTWQVGEAGGAGAALRDSGEIAQALRTAATSSEAFAWVKEYAAELQEQYCAQSCSSAQTRKILEYLQLHYSEHLSLADVAEYMGISSTHVCRLIKKDTGETFVTLLNKIRIMEAIRMLKKGDRKVYEIAEAAGFSNYAYFYQMFKKETGMSPKDYR